MQQKMFPWGLTLEESAVEVYETLLNYVLEIGMEDILQVGMNDPLDEYEGYTDDESIEIHIDSFDFPEFGSIMEELTPDGRWITYINGNMREDYDMLQAPPRIFDQMIEGAKWLISAKLERV